MFDISPPTAADILRTGGLPVITAQPQKAVVQVPSAISSDSNIAINNHQKRCKVCCGERATPVPANMPFINDPIAEMFDSISKYKVLRTEEGRKAFEHFVWSQMPTLFGDSSKLWKPKSSTKPFFDCLAKRRAFLFAQGRPVDEIDRLTVQGREALIFLEEEIKKYSQQNLADPEYKVDILSEPSDHRCEYTDKNNCWRHPSKDVRLEYRKDPTQMGKQSVRKEMFQKLTERYEQRNIVLTAKDKARFGLCLSRYLRRQTFYNRPGLSFSVRKNVLLSLKNNFGVDHECFASPHEAVLTSFNSAFEDIDVQFGSQGSFFQRFDRTAGAFECNPVWVESVLAVQIMHTLSLLKLASVEPGSPLVFFIFWPAWLDSDASLILDQNSQYLVYDIRLPAGANMYEDKTIAGRGAGVRSVNKDQRLIVLASLSLKQRWTDDNSKLDLKMKDVLSALYSESKEEPIAVTQKRQKEFRQQKHSYVPSSIPASANSGIPADSSNSSIPSDSSNSGIPAETRKKTVFEEIQEMKDELASLGLQVNEAARVGNKILAEELKRRWDELGKKLQAREIKEARKIRIAEEK